MPIQFGTLIAGIDAVVSVATKMAEVFKRRSEQAKSQSSGEPGQVIRDLQQRVAALEANEAEQYKLIEDLAKTVRTLTDDMRIVTRRTTVTMILSAIAALLGAVALVVVLAK